MRLDQALAKIGVQVIEANPQAGQLTIHLRVLRDHQGLNASRWNKAASKLVTLAESSGRKSGSWDGEVAKVLSANAGVVTYTWRVVLTGNVKTAQRIFGEAALEALRTGVEVTSAPLIGQVQYEYDPAKGKLKGGHPVGSAGDSAGPANIAPHFTPGI